MWVVPKIWPRETVFILGGGPSLADVDVRALEGRHVIACNNAYLLAPWADVLCWADPIWYDWNFHDFDRHRGPYRVTWRRMPEKPNAPKFFRLFQFRAPVVLSHDATGVVGESTGFGALNLAVLFGAWRVVLVGFDMKPRDGRNNWHALHRREPERDPYPRFMASFEAALPELRRAGVEVVNASPDSALACFPRIAFADALELSPPKLGGVAPEAVAAGR